MCWIDGNMKQVIQTIVGKQKLPLNSRDVHVMPTPTYTLCRLRSDLIGVRSKLEVETQSELYTWKMSRLETVGLGLESFGFRSRLAYASLCIFFISGSNAHSHISSNKLNALLTFLLLLRTSSLSSHLSTSSLSTTVWPHWCFSPWFSKEAESFWEIARPAGGLTRRLRMRRGLKWG